jgi:hypothetical protein
MRNLLGTVKWLLIGLVLAGWFAISLANRQLETVFVLVPGILEYQSVPLPVLLILPLVVAFCVFWVVGMLDQVDHFFHARELKKRIRDLEQEVDQLRNLPIRDGTLEDRRGEEEGPPC